LSGGATREVISLLPRVEQPVWGDEAMGLEALARTRPLQKSLPFQVGDDSRDQAGGCAGAGRQLGLPPLAGWVGEQGADNPGTLADKDISRFLLEAKVPAAKRGQLHQQAGGAQIEPAV